ncbi:arsenical pump-driving ATPase [Desertibacillus haloalkaliphilus]|uniref:arsenical pump-driving ATPase n=1 Tax=Desertibacillus haloalkaliphilus TaxID=1328930 RepID=UPI001C259000|nr:arsenical pump-driving ATPase [Desertibacillus haloalkaliphilus]MBU8906660.1 arsenical pump-driving ATPase [Desertibacillus haloalkaliphilus]
MTERFQLETIPLTPYFFFTGKGGVGKTSTACATAVALAERGKRVLIVSTDPASNLQDVFETEIGSRVTPLPEVKGLSAININPEEAAAAYREKVVGPYRDKLPAPVVAQMEEQLSGACTVEIAAFDEFATLLTSREKAEEFDHIIFDTAPTGHTLRLLQLPTAWSNFLDESTHGASCLGPLSGLAEKKKLYEATVEALANKDKTTLVLVSRPNDSALYEAGRASNELMTVGLENQLLLINGQVSEFVSGDKVSEAFYKQQQEALGELPTNLQQLPSYQLPLVPYQLTGIEALRALFTDKDQKREVVINDHEEVDTRGLEKLVEELEEKQSGVLLTMGKGGVGKTTVAAAVAVGLAEKGHNVHLTTTDPAEHLSLLFEDDKIGETLTVSRIDPEAEVSNYREEVLAEARKTLDESGLEYLEEDLRSPCTEEIAVFRAFANVVDRADDDFVIIDTAPTGHTLLLLDSAQSYHKEIERSTGEVPESVQKLLPRLRDPQETDVVIVTLPEATPVHEARRLQLDLERANITPRWWVINQSFVVTDTRDPLLNMRAAAELPWIKTVTSELAEQTVVIPWQPEATTSYRQLKALSY